MDNGRKIVGGGAGGGKEKKKEMLQSVFAYFVDPFFYTVAAKV